MSFRDNLEKDAKEAGIGGGGRFTWQEGKNRLRVMTEPKAHTSGFTDKMTGEQTINTKFICYVLDRADGQIKLAFMPYKFAKGLAELEEDEVAPWGGSFPMPYDVTIEVESPGKMTVKYGAVRPTKESELTEKEREDFSSAKPIQEIRDALNKKQMNTASEISFTPEHDLSEIPFG